jgi:DNA-binding LytR/AlgR family response regulator
VKSDYKQFVIPTATITYIEGIRDYIRIHSSDRPAVQTLMTLKTVEEMLPPEGFARVHRSYIVALDRVKRIERSHIILDAGVSSGGLSGGASGGEVTIPVSDTYREAFLKSLSNR